MSKDRVHTVDPAPVGAATRDPQPALPKAIWEGVLDVAGFQMRAYVLEDGTRIFNAEDVERFFALALADDAQ